MFIDVSYSLVLSQTGHKLSGSRIFRVILIVNFHLGDIFEREEDIEDQTIWRSAGSTDPQRQERSRLQLAELADYIIPGHGPIFKVTERMRNILRIQVDS